MNKYRFNNSLDEKGNPQHLHQLWSESDEEFKNLTGTSSVVDVLGKPLTWWASGLACAKLGWIKKADTRKSTKEEISENDNLRIESAELWREKIWTMSPLDYLKLLDEAYKAHSEKTDKAKDEGTELHERLELAVKMMMDGVKVISSPEPKVMEFVKWAETNVKRFLWSEMNCYSSFHFIGGISDAGAELNDGSIALIDFKSAREAYFSHFVQTAGYAIQIEENGGYNAKGEKVFTPEKPITKYIVFPFGMKKLEPTINLNTSGMKRAFLGALAIYREKGIWES